MALPSDAAPLDARRTSAGPRTAGLAGNSTKHKPHSSVQDALLPAHDVMQIEAETPREDEASAPRARMLMATLHVMDGNQPTPTPTPTAAPHHHAILGWRRVYFVAMYCATIALLYADQNLLAPTMTGSTRTI